MAGLMLAKLKHLPMGGEAWEHGGLEVKVMPADDRRIESVLAKRTALEGRAEAFGKSGR